MAPPSRLRPSLTAGLCPACVGTGTMPRGAPADQRVDCAACGGVGALV